MSDFEELKQRAIKVREMYDVLNQKQRGRQWEKLKEQRNLRR